MTKLQQAKELLGLWLEPLKIPCSAPAHQDDGKILSCTCRNVEIRRRTNEFLGRCRKASSDRTK